MVLVEVNPVIWVSPSGWGVYKGNQVCGFDLCLLSFDTQGLLKFMNNIFVFCLSSVWLLGNLGSAYVS